MGEEYLQDWEVGEESEKALDLIWEKTMHTPQRLLITDDSFEKYNPPLSYDEYYETVLEKQKVEGNEKNISGKEEIKDKKKRITDNTQLQTNYHKILPQPKLSSVGQSDRSFYRFFMEGKSMGRPMKTSHEQKFQALMSRVHQEQQNYQRFLSLSAQKYMNQYLFVHPKAEKAVQEYIYRCAEEASEILDKSYKLESTIPIRTLVDMSRKKNVVLKLEEVIKEPKEKPRMMWPTSFQNLSTEYFYPFEENRFNRNDIPEKVRFDVFMEIETVIDIIKGFVSFDSFRVPFSVQHAEDCAEGYKRLYFDRTLYDNVISSRDANSKFYRSTVIKNVSDSKFNDADLTVLNLFSLGQIKLLVMSKLDFCNEFNDAIRVQAKVEYQSNIGFEQLSFKELCNIWWDSILSNTNKITCVRVDPRNEVILRIDHYSRDKMFLPNCPYNPQTNVDQLCALLTDLTKLKYGEYFLEKLHGKDSINIFKHSDNYGFLLRNKFENILNGSGLKFEDEQYNWLPIDMTILPPHTGEFDIPWLFEKPPDIPKNNLTRNRKRKRGNQVKSAQETSNRTKQARKGRENTTLVESSSIFEEQGKRTVDDREFEFFTT